MPELTVTEKSHWKDRIAARIDKAVERARARHPALFDRVRHEAHAEALRSLGLADPHAEPAACRDEEAATARRKKRAQRAMLAALRGVLADEVPDNYSVRYGTDPALPTEAVEAIARRQSAHQDQLLADDPVGREVARLGPRRRACWTRSGWRPRRGRSSSSGRGSPSCWATSRRPWSARRWRSGRSRRGDQPELRHQPPIPRVAQARPHHNHIPPGRGDPADQRMEEDRWVRVQGRS